ncbi:hypothetical protein DPMN_158052 [Dreissena polymorpha]|uniref:Uncharacterized protein n=1 Tax=Dreissena polymorpha TaxID=45954 RepID=A0A9D4ELR3_DREPO|nr:hypothetical protein DPMN_158052 [Dreissena polymorpha]
MKDIWLAFTGSYTSCESQIPQLVSEVIKKCYNAAQLQRENKERYHWKWCDVFMFEPATPKIFAAYEVKTNQSFSDINLGLTKSVTFGIENVPTTQLTDVLMAIVNDEHIYGSYHAGEIMLKIKLGLKKRHIEYSAVVVFFNNDEHKPDVEIDKGRFCR